MLRRFKFLAALSLGPDVMIAKYRIENGSMTGDWFKLGSTEMGGAATMSGN